MKKVVKLKELELKNLISEIITESKNNKKFIKITESQLRKIIKNNINESEEPSNIGFDEYAIQKFKSAGFKKVSNTLYKKDVSPAKTLKVELYTKACADGFTFFVNDKPIYQGCPDDCWVWWSKQRFN